MKILFLNIALFLSLVCFSQNVQLANYYFEKGDFEKAKISFEELLNATPQNSNYFQKTIKGYQQLQQFDVHTKNEGSLFLPFFIHFLVYPMAKENLLIILIFIMQIPFQKVLSIG
jgi:tetratricopeptide (TPR) repeat protein